MNIFKQLETAAETKVKAEETKLSAFLTKYRWALYLGCMVIGFVLAKVL